MEFLLVKEAPPMGYEEDSGDHRDEDTDGAELA
jgi:hypothetical protein